MLLLTRPSGSASAAGIGFALLAGGFWAAYILLSARVGRAFSGGRGLALAMGVAAALMVVPGPRPRAATCSTPEPLRSAPRPRC